MTTLIDIKEIVKEPVEVKKITFTRAIIFLGSPTQGIQISSGDDYPTHTPDYWEHVSLLCTEYYYEYDLMFAWDRQEKGCLYLGHWNDGVI